MAHEDERNIAMRQRTTVNIIIMGKKSKRRTKKIASMLSTSKPQIPVQPTANSFLDVMVDGIEFESLCKYQYENVNIPNEVRRSIKEVEDARGKRAICYFANLFSPFNSIDEADDLPFTEMVNAIPANIREIDVLLVTPGGSGAQAANFVSTLRKRFDIVNFIVIDKAMSAGTILIMSGDEIVMSKESKFGPIDPQIPSRDGRYVPAQSILRTINDIQSRGAAKLKNGEQPNWTDIQILRNISATEIGSALSSSQYSIDLVKKYLHDFKFRNWTIHSSSGFPVTDAERKQRAVEIATDLCNHQKWNSHSYAISRDEAQNVCRLKITNAESIQGLERAVRRLRALLCWMGRKNTYSKIFASQEYFIINNRR